MDVKTAYLHGELEEEIYVAAPEGLNVPEGHALCLWKALYGLKQAAKQWHKKLSSVLAEFGLKQISNKPNTFFVRKVIKGEPKILIVPVYVDDLFLIGNKELTDEFESWIVKYFDCTIIGDAILFLGIRVTRDRTPGQEALTLDQTVFVDNFLT